MDKKFLDESGYNYYFLKGESERTGGLATFCKKMPRVVKRFFNEADDALGRASVLEFEDFTFTFMRLLEQARKQTCLRNSITTTT